MLFCGEFMFPSVPPARVSRQPDGMAGEIRLVPWNHGAGMWSLGGGRMGVLCSKAVELEKNENERSMGWEANHKENSFKTSPQAFPPRAAWSINLQSFCSARRLKKRFIYKIGLHFYFRCISLTKATSSQCRPGFILLTELASPMGNFSSEIWYIPEERIGVWIWIRERMDRFINLTDIAQIIPVIRYWAHSKFVIIIISMIASKSSWKIPSC